MSIYNTEIANFANFLHNADDLFTLMLPSHCLDPLLLQPKITNVAVKKLYKKCITNRLSTDVFFVRLLICFRVMALISPNKRYLM